MTSLNPQSIELLRGLSQQLFQTLDKQDRKTHNAISYRELKQAGVADNNEFWGFNTDSTTLNNTTHVWTQKEFEQYMMFSALHQAKANPMTWDPSKVTEEQSKAFDKTIADWTASSQAANASDIFQAQKPAFQAVSALLAEQLKKSPSPSNIYNAIQSAASKMPLVSPPQQPADDSNPPAAATAPAAAPDTTTATPPPTVAQQTEATPPAAAPATTATSPPTVAQQTEATPPAAAPATTATSPPLEPTATAALTPKQQSALMAYKQQLEAHYRAQANQLYASTQSIAYQRAQQQLAQQYQARYQAAMQEAYYANLSNQYLSILNPAVQLCSGGGFSYGGNDSYFG